jgi:hypothetical protein
MSYFSGFKIIPYDLNGDGIYDNVTNLAIISKISKALINNVTLYDFININDGERPDQLSFRLYDSVEYYWTFLLINNSINNVWNDWPKSSNQLEEYCDRKYEGIVAVTDEDLIDKFKIGEQVKGQVSNAIGTIKRIHRNNKYLIIDLEVGNFIESGESIYGLDSQDNVTCTYIKTAPNAPYWHIDKSTGVPTQPRLTGTTPFTFFNYEHMINNNNRNIRAIKPEFIAEIAEEFIKEMSS